MECKDLKIRALDTLSQKKKRKEKSKKVKLMVNNTLTLAALEYFNFKPNARGKVLSASNVWLFPTTICHVAVCLFFLSFSLL